MRRQVQIIALIFTSRGTQAPRGGISLWVLHLESGRVWAGGCRACWESQQHAAWLSELRHSRPATAPPSWSGPSALIQGDVASDGTSHTWTASSSNLGCSTSSSSHPCCSPPPPLPYYFGFRALSPRPLMPHLSSLAIQPLLQHEFPSNSAFLL